MSPLSCVDRDLRVDAHRLFADAVIVEEGFGLVDARGEGRDTVRRHFISVSLKMCSIASIIDLLAELLEQLVEAAMRQLARRHLRAHVAERGIREADVVADDLQAGLR